MRDRIMGRFSESRRVLAVAALVVAGCVGDKPDSNRPDPLTGLPKRVPPAERAVSSTFNPQRNDAAVLASANPRAEGVSGLGIRDGRAPEPDRSVQNTAWTGTESRGGPAPAAGAKLGAAPPSNGGAAPVTAGGVRVRTFEEAQQFLKARGVRWQELQTTGENEWKFSCSIPNRNNPSSVRNYEARDGYGLLAMQKVIDQISRDEQAR